MAKASLSKIAGYCNRLLRTEKINDYDGAVNGLQMANQGAVTRIAAAVDASDQTIRKAVESGADLLIVHHGLFWSTRQPWTGTNYEILRLLVENNLAVYSSHLPLDMHPKLGNNTLLCAVLGLKNLRPFFFDKGQFLGFQTRMRIPVSQLMRRLERATGAKPLLLPGRETSALRIGVVTGGAGGELEKAASEGVDTFITGEGPHWTFALAGELGVNVLYGGHYATETFGVKALARHLSEKFKVPWTYIDHPSGL